MTISIWRYSHLILAVISSLFILIASVTGAILAFEPISNQLQPFAIEDGNMVSLAEILPTLQQNYDEVFTVEIDKNNFVSTSVITKEGNSETFYINPFTGEKLGEIIKKAPIFEFATNLHRSLFLKTTGRILIGVVSFLLFIIAITGIQLILKRQGGLKRFFSKVVKENFEQYYHVVIGRYTLIPIIIITLTGVFLSLEKFNLLPDSKISHNYPEPTEIDNPLEIDNFTIFQDIKLNDVTSVEFPFSDDIEDYFIIKLKGKELLVNQFSGEVVSNQNTSFVALISNWSLILHTGQGTVIWSIILLIASLAILFFMYSGFAMTLKRRRATSKIKNKFTKDNAEYIILVGSETGHTFNAAKLFYNALIETSQSAYISVLNDYSTYNEAKQLIIFAATYGEGEAPNSASNFKQLFKKVNPQQNIQYAVIGFGSFMYPDYCKYAVEVDLLLRNHEKFDENLPLFKINNQSFEEYKLWINQWNHQNNLDLKIQFKRPKINLKNLKEFRVVNKTKPNIDNSFLVQLRPLKKSKFSSGDLLSVFPEVDFIERQYSIGKIENDILLSIKKHEFGVCSTYFNNLKVNSIVKAKVKRNFDFHFPNTTSEVVMIANGTGIAPFLGMVSDNANKIKTHLFWGGRTKDSLKLYKNIIDEALNEQKLTNFYTAYSQEQKDKIYVQDLILERQELLSQVLDNNGIIMICGSIAMQNRVLEVLNIITTRHLNKALSEFESNSQLKKDCY
ncbi:PepSY domain-containing protein [Winogradskyella bathintestinalis]|uniref:PepSY domain-containing protein n=1 Tax=Winogradskyella bathintestinalis TaxID=3035208 RepID=A0ABT7ZXJ7_9FLAO|nr:PepSY domain-containing protein [Winogradskyella bathintestinalis]MDN3493661.1 PepSY domain-containing protein [Winogradskyella bathintestinalis]